MSVSDDDTSTISSSYKVLAKEQVSEVELELKPYDNFRSLPENMDHPSLV